MDSHPLGRSNHFYIVVHIACIPCITGFLKPWLSEPHLGPTWDLQTHSPGLDAYAWCPPSPAVMAGTLMAGTARLAMVRSSGEVWRMAWLQKWLTPLKNEKGSSVDYDEIPNIWKNKTCSKPPTSLSSLCQLVPYCQWCWFVGTETVLAIAESSFAWFSWQAAQWSREEVTKIFHDFSRLFVVQWKGLKKQGEFGPVMVCLSVGRSWRFTFFLWRSGVSPWCLAGKLSWCGLTLQSADEASGFCPRFTFTDLSWDHW